MQASLVAHGPRLRRVLTKLLGADPDVPDLLQDVFVAAFQGLGRLQDPRALPAWLTQIAVNLARGHIRGRVLDRALYGELVGEAASRSLAIDEQYSVHEALARLPERERVPFRLRFFEQQELQDVAASCRLSVPTVKRRLASARRRFQRDQLASQ